MKGIELPINVLVIVALAVIVLLGVIALFSGVFGPGSAGIAMSSAWNQACGGITSSCSADHSGNTVTNFKIGTTTVHTFGGLCIAMYKNTSPETDTSTNGCNKACGCP